MKKRSAITLLEIMIVITNIGLIATLVGYNMKGSLDKGRAFRSEQGIEQLESLFSLALSEGKTIKEIKKDPEKVLKELNLVSNPEKLLKDGWGKPYIIDEDSERGVRVSSSAYEAYKKQEDERKEKLK